MFFERGRICSHVLRLSFSFFFIMDIVGTASLLVEFSFVKTQMQEMLGSSRFATSMIRKNEARTCRQCLGLASWPILKSLNIHLWDKRGGFEKIALLFTRALGTNYRCSIFHDDSKLFRVCLCSVSHMMSTSPTAWSSSISFLQSSHFHPFPTNQCQCSYRMLYTHCARWRISRWPKASARFTKQSHSAAQEQPDSKLSGDACHASCQNRCACRALDTAGEIVPRQELGIWQAVAVAEKWKISYGCSGFGNIGESTRSTWLKDTLSLLHHTEAIFPCRNSLLFFALHQTTCNRGCDSFHSWGRASKWYLEGAIPDPKPK